MGTNCAPSYANLYLISFELEWRAMFPNIFKCYFRFLDDCFIAYERPETNADQLLNRFMTTVNSSAKTLKFNFKLATLENPSVTFLDLEISTNEIFKRFLKLSFKPYDSTHPSSYHPHAQCSAG